MTDPRTRTRPLDHWVCISDDDLAFIQEGPRSWNQRDLENFVRDLTEIIEDGLETA